jgi:hypothetical protein
MANITVTLLYGEENKHWDLSLPSNVPLRLFLSGLMEKLVGQDAAGDKIWILRNRDTGDSLDMDSNLDDAGTLPGDVFHIRAARASSVPDFPKDVTIDPSRYPGCLIAPDGKVFPLTEKFTTLGRSSNVSSGFIDLTDYDPGARCSRRHAQIISENARFKVRDVGSKNGTYVNDQLVSGDQRLALQIGDVICFGEGGGPALKFHINK